MIMVIVVMIHVIIVYDKDIISYRDNNEGSVTEKKSLAFRDAEKEGKQGLNP